jgi:inosine-uridine nucleoside N-ribohydrolase
MRNWGNAADAERYCLRGLAVYDTCVIAWLLPSGLFARAGHRVHVEVERRFCHGRTASYDGVRGFGG